MRRSCWVSFPPTASSLASLTLAMCCSIISFYGRPRMNIRLGRIHQRRSIPDSIPVVRGAKCYVVFGASGHCGFVEFIDLILICCHEPPMNSRGIGFPLLYPEERPLAITKSPQIRMTVFALIRHEEFDIKRLQGRLIEGQRTFDIADSQNHVVEHCSLLQITRLQRPFHRWATPRTDNPSEAT